MALAGPQEIDESPRVFGRDVAVALVPVPMGPRRRTELHENPCAIDVAQALRPAASRLFGPLLAASRAGAREGAFEAAASALVPSLVGRPESGAEKRPDESGRGRQECLRHVALLLIALFAVGCRQDMHDQPKYIPLRPSQFFADGRSERPLIEGTVARGHLDDDTAFYTGKGPDGKPLDTFPFAVTKADIERGQDRFNVYCTPCHGRLGDGNGMIVQRGFRQPPSYHIDRLRQVPNGYIYDVITNGFGAMQDYSAQIPPRDRWAIVAYIRALQLSHNATIEDVPADARAQLSAGGAR